MGPIGDQRDILPCTELLISGNMFGPVDWYSVLLVAVLLERRCFSNAEIMCRL
jgi:hypothetical protein